MMCLGFILWFPSIFLLRFLMVFLWYFFGMIRSIGDNLKFQNSVRFIGGERSQGFHPH